MHWDSLPPSETAEWGRVQLNYSATRIGQVGPRGASRVRPSRAEWLGMH